MKHGTMVDRASGSPSMCVAWTWMEEDGEATSSLRVNPEHNSYTECYGWGLKLTSLLVLVAAARRPRRTSEPEDSELQGRSPS